MAQEIKKVEVVQIDEKCPQCKEGYMRPTGIVLVDEYNKFPHRCNKCGYETSYDVKFPYTV